MRKRDEVKHALEKFAASKVVELTGTNAVYIRHGDDKKEPDVLFEINKKVLGIEVGTAYYTSDTARQDWTLITNERSFPAAGYEMNWGGTLLNPDKLINDEALRILTKKQTNTYEGAHDVWLVIYLHAPLLDKAGVEECKTILQPGLTGVFKHVYLLYLLPVHEEGKYEITALS